MKKLLLLSLFLPILFAACSDSDNGIDDGDVTIATPAITATTGTSLTVISSVTGSSHQVVKKGFCYSVNAQNPSIADNTVDADENFSATISGLTAGTSYYVRAYIYSNSRYTYSDVLTATTDNLSVDEQLKNYVAPTYADNYTSLSSWTQRSQWNLANVHDPSVEKCGDYYYMYQTDASYGNVHEGHGHFPYRRSKDLVNWEFQGMAMSDIPAWVKDTLNNMRNRLGLPAIDSPSYGYWAPVVRKAGSKYRMYYSIVIDNYIETGKQNTTANFDGSWTERAFIGLMETDDLAGNVWTDKGMVVCSSTDKGRDWSRPNATIWSGYFKWNAIDPGFVITPEGKHYLVYGSWHSGLVALEVNAETGKPDELGEPWDATALPNYGTRIYTRKDGERWQGSEAPEIIYNAQTGYYYLFLAYDALAIPYNTRVCRSTNIEGPYEGYGGTSLANGGDAFPIITHPYKFNGHTGWVGISHCCLFQDASGQWYYASQGRLPEGVAGINVSNAVMMGHVRKVRWTEDGWPVVMPERYAAVPDVEISEAEIAGTWEHIVLEYKYGVQNTANTLTLTSDKQASGAMTGTWSWDAAKKILTIGSYKLCVEREVDWEANPRTHTLVYAGLNTSGRSLWGKKR